MSKFEINRITKELIRAILRFRSFFLPPKCTKNNIQKLLQGVNGCVIPVSNSPLNDSK
jgi:hypothetical protein